MTYNEEIKTTLNRYPKLKYDSSNRTLIGEIEINHTFYDEHIIAMYEVLIKIPIAYPKEPPIVTNIGKKIPNKFGHAYMDGSLCLATDADQLIFFTTGNNLADWIEAYVIPYYFAVEYFKKYNVYPFGERSHGAKGILEYYLELFKVDNFKSAFRILEYIVNSKYRGHNLCPCGSGVKIRNCHNDIIIGWKQEKYQEIFKQDYISIINEKHRR